MDDEPQLEEFFSHLGPLVYGNYRPDIGKYYTRAIELANEYLRSDDLEGRYKVSILLKLLTGLLDSKGSVDDISTSKSYIEYFPHPHHIWERLDTLKSQGWSVTKVVADGRATDISLYKYRNTLVEIKDPFDLLVVAQNTNTLEVFYDDDISDELLPSIFRGSEDAVKDIAIKMLRQGWIIFEFKPVTYHYYKFRAYHKFSTERFDFDNVDVMVVEIAPRFRALLIEFADGPGQPASSSSSGMSSHYALPEFPIINARLESLQKQGWIISEGGRVKDSSGQYIIKLTLFKDNTKITRILDPLDILLLVRDVFELYVVFQESVPDILLQSNLVRFNSDLINTLTRDGWVITSAFKKDSETIVETAYHADAEIFRPGVKRVTIGKGINVLKFSR